MEVSAFSECFLFHNEDVLGKQNVILLCIYYLMIFYDIDMMQDRYDKTASKRTLFHFCDIKPYLGLNLIYRTSYRTQSYVNHTYEVIL